MFFRIFEMVRPARVFRISKMAAPTRHPLSRKTRVRVLLELDHKGLELGRTVRLAGHKKIESKKTQVSKGGVSR